MSTRTLYFFGFLFSFIALIYAFFLQYGQGLEPCALCMMSRVVLIAIVILFLLGFLHNPKKKWKRWIYAGIGVCLSSLGMVITARHVWLQSLPPDEAPACGPGFSYLLEVLPLREAIQQALTGSGDCALIQGTFLSLSLPSWTFILFTLLTVLFLISSILE